MALFCASHFGRARADAWKDLQSECHPREPSAGFGLRLNSAFRGNDGAAWRALNRRRRVARRAMVDARIAARDGHAPVGQDSMPNP